MSAILTDHALVRDGTAVSLDPVETAFVRALAQALALDADRIESARGFVKSTELVHLLPEAGELATQQILYVARRLERKLAALGDPPMLEACERRGYRLRAPLG